MPRLLLLLQIPHYQQMKNRIHTKFIFQDIKKKGVVATEFYFRLIAVMTMSTKTILLRWQDPVFDEECSGKLRVGLMRDPRTGGN